MKSKPRESRTLLERWRRRREFKRGVRRLGLELERLYGRRRYSEKQVSDAAKQIRIAEHELFPHAACMFLGRREFKHASNASLVGQDYRSLRKEAVAMLGLRPRRNAAAFPGFAPAGWGAGGGDFSAGAGHG